MTPCPRVLPLAAALLVSLAVPASAQVGPPEGDGAVIDLGPFGEVGDVTTAGQATGLGTGRPGPDDPTREYVLGAAVPLDPVLPESIAFDRATGSFFTASALNGAIYKGALDEDVAEEFLPPLTGNRLMRLGVEVSGDRLYVVSAMQGTIDVFDTTTAEQMGTFDTGPGGILNDLVVDPAGDLYVTDSVRSTLFRVPAGVLAAGTGPVEEVPLAPEVEFTAAPRINGTFNVNGIVATGPGELVLGKTNTDQLFRVVVGDDPAARTVAPVELEGEMMTPDGMELVGERLFVMNNLANAVVEVDLADDLASGSVVGRTTDPTFSTATGIASTGERLLISNSQFFTAPMVVPATVSSISIPVADARPAPAAPEGAPVGAQPRVAEAPVAADADALATTGPGGAAALGVLAAGAGLGAARLRRRRTVRQP